MTDDNDARIFECYFTDAPRFDRIFVWSMSIVVIVVLALIPTNGNIYPLLIFGLLYMLLPFWFEFQIHMIRTRSYIKLIDNEIVVKRWGGGRATFPIDRIESVRVVNFDTDIVDKHTKDYRLPMAMGRVNLYPQKGVIVFFERKWIKSIQPVFFNPADPEQFAQALAEESGKTSISDPQ